MEKLRLGGMALSNGVLVHGPTAWARPSAPPTGRSSPPRREALRAGVTTPFARGPVAAGRGVHILPDVRRAPRRDSPSAPVAAAIVAGAAAGLARRSGLGLGAREAVAALASLAPAVVALRGGKLAFLPRRPAHLDRHLRDGRPATRTRPLRRLSRRAASLTTATASALAARARRGLADGPCCRCGRAVSAAVEIFAWMGRHPGARSRARWRARARAAGPRLDGQPSAQLEVAEAAWPCLAAEVASSA
jgi:hypothetical protein